MATAYHRRPRPSGLDIAAVAHNKIGSGSVWQGYYMYTGGTNPSDKEHCYTTGLQESQDTGYPNDLPRYDYDFHAPIGASGRLSTTHNLLRRQHAFLAAFGSSLAPMESKLPHDGPPDIEDLTTLRWAIRSDGKSAFLFITWHQPYIPLNTYEGAQFDITMGGKRMLFPSRPVAIPSGTLAHWPLNLVIDQVELEWATASPLTTLQDGTTTVLVLAVEHGIPLTWKWADDVTITPYGDDGEDVTSPGNLTQARVYRCSSPTTHIDVLVLPATDADLVWVLGDGIERQLLISPDPIWLGTDGLVAGRTTAPHPEVRRYASASRTFITVPTQSLSDPSARQPLSTVLVRPPGDVPASYGEIGGRASAPAQSTIDELAASYEVEVSDSGGTNAGRCELEIQWRGDIAQIVVDSTVVADRFWDGSPWIVDLDALEVGSAATLSINVLPVNEHHSLNLPQDMPLTSRLEDQQHDELSVELVRWHHWIESPRDRSSL